jgi:hypothetical protein
MPLDYSKDDSWPDVYSNSLKVYQPHNDQERQFVYDDTPRYMLLKGGEGAGKSVAGIVKVLDRLRRGCNGVMVSPDLEHFKKSLWPEFRRWCPWQCVIPRHQYRQVEGWEPSKTFLLVFKNEVGGYSELLCGGAKESEIGAWEGPNVNFVHFDEARRHKEGVALKTFDGRIRIPGPAGEPPQMFFTTTPRKHWLYDYFGPLKEHDTLADFKANSFVATVLTEENAENLEPGFVDLRRMSLNENEARILLQAEWEDESDTEKFVNIIWWDNCKEELPPLRRDEPIVIALDANKGSTTVGYVADAFSMVAVSRHPARLQDVATRYCGIWQPQPGQLMDYQPIEQELIRLCQSYSVVEVCYDPTQLHKLATDMKRDGIAHFREFSQQLDRLKADKQLQTMIISRQIAHDGNPLLRQHIDNANAKKYSDGSIRIVKRSDSLKVDAAVALSMATARILHYNVV